MNIFDLKRKAQGWNLLEGGGRPDSGNYAPPVNTWDKTINRSWGHDGVNTQTIANPNYIERSIGAQHFVDKNGNPITDTSGFTAQYGQMEAKHGSGTVDDPSQFQNYVRNNHNGTFTTFTADGKEGATYTPHSDGGFLGGLGDAVSSIASSPIGALAIGAFAPEMIPALSGLSAPAAAGIISGGINLAATGNPESALKSGLTAAAGNAVGGWASGAAGGGVGGSLASGAAKGATGALAYGRDPLTGIITGAIKGGVGDAVSSAVNSDGQSPVAGQIASGMVNNEIGKALQPSVSHVQSAGWSQGPTATPTQTTQTPQPTQVAQPSSPIDATIGDLTAAFKAGALKNNGVSP